VQVYEEYKALLEQDDDQITSLRDQTIALQRDFTVHFDVSCTDRQSVPDGISQNVCASCYRAVDGLKSKRVAEAEKRLGHLMSTFTQRKYTFSSLNYS
jgi:hypothetical protein